MPFILSCLFSSQAKDLLVRDAFMAFNSSHSGSITCSELYGGLIWLGMRVDPPMIHDIVRTIDTDCDGYVSWQEFKRAFAFKTRTAGICICLNMHLQMHISRYWPLKPMIHDVAHMVMPDTTLLRVLVVTSIKE